MSGPADSELLRLDRAAANLGWTDTSRRRQHGATRRAEVLRDAILAREAETGLRIALRRGGKVRSVMLVTMHALREHLPELFPGAATKLRDQGAFVRTMRSIDSKIAASREGLEGRVAVVEYEGQVTRAMVVDLSQQVDSLAGIVAEMSGANDGKKAQDGDIQKE